MSNKNYFTIAGIATGTLNDLVENLMRGMEISDPVEAVRRINSREWLPFKPANFWREDGLIHLKVTSDGTDNESWINYFKKQGFNVESSAKKILRSMIPTSGVTTEVVVYEDAVNINRSLHKKLNLEVACLIRKNFTDQDLKIMGLRKILIYHNLIAGPNLLTVSRCGIGNWLDTSYFEVEDRIGSGVAFAV